MSPPMITKNLGEYMRRNGIFTKISGKARRTHNYGLMFAARDTFLATQQAPGVQYVEAKDKQKNMLRSSRTLVEESTE
jgi:hypothetical protein